MQRLTAMFLVSMFMLAPLAGCFGEDEETPVVAKLVPDELVGCSVEIAARNVDQDDQWQHAMLWCSGYRPWGTVSSYR